MKALSCVIFAKLILKEFNIKIGFHSYLKQCAKNRGDEIKKYGKLCQKTLKELKHLKYGRTLFNKYQMKNYQCVLNTYLSGFINNCFRWLFVILFFENDFFFEDLFIIYYYI